MHRAERYMATYRRRVPLAIRSRLSGVTRKVRSFMPDSVEMSPAAAPVLITDGALITTDAVWAWVLVPIASTFLAEEDDLDQATLATARSVRRLIEPVEACVRSCSWLPGDLALKSKRKKTFNAQAFLDSAGTRRLRMAPESGASQRRS